MLKLFSGLVCCSLGFFRNENKIAAGAAYAENFNFLEFLIQFFNVRAAKAAKAAKALLASKDMGLSHQRNSSPRVERKII